MSFTPVRTVLGAAVLLAASFSSQATLIVNGDFETNTLSPGNWTFLNSSQVDGWQGSNIEIWNALNGVTAASGNHFIELNAHGANSGAWSIFQPFATEIGRQYQLSFYYRARSNNNEQFQAMLADASWTLNDHVTGSWKLFSNVFVATATETTLTLKALNGGTSGNFIDDVQVNALPAATAVPAPATLAAFGAGLLALLAGRRFRRNSKQQ